MNSDVYQNILQMSGHLFVTSSWSALRFCSRTVTQNTPAIPPLNGLSKVKWSLWRGLIKVLTWIQLRCCGRTLKRRLMLENPPMWLNYNNSAKIRGPTFLHSAVEDSLPVIVNAWLQLLLLYCCFCWPNQLLGYQLSLFPHRAMQVWSFSPLIINTLI